MGINAIEEFDACFPDLKDRVKPNAHYNLKKVLKHYIWKMLVMEVANALGKPVMTPNKTLWCSPKGTLYVSSDEWNLDKGSFVTFKPGGIKHGK